MQKAQPASVDSAGGGVYNLKKQAARQELFFEQQNPLLEQRREMEKQLPEQREQLEGRLEQQLEQDSYREQRDEAYPETLRSFLEYKQGKVRPAVFNKIRENTLRRKRNLCAEYESFFTSLIKERCQVLDADSAAVLKTKYLGAPEGERFWFTN